MIGANQQPSVLGRINSFTNIWDAGLVLFGMHLLVVAYSRTAPDTSRRSSRNAARDCRSRLPVRQPECGAHPWDFDS